MKKPVTFGFDADVLAKARHFAQRDNRTLTNLIETILKQSLDGKEWDDGALKVQGDRV